MRGCQKRIIQVKNMTSSIFDEAYFILRENASATSQSEGDMVQEAGRIIEENQITLRRKRKFLPRHWQSFLSGAAAAAGICGLLWWLL